MATEGHETPSNDEDEKLKDLAAMAYQYTSLSTSHSIRLMELHSSQLGDVTINLVAAEIDSAPPYEAISYVWGDPNIKVSITCEGRSIKVTPNLKDALIHMRPESGTRTLWADAACINQDDLEERSQQVRIMSTIYAKATRTLVWLGSDSHEYQEVFPLMEKIGSLYCEENSITPADLCKLDHFVELRRFSIDKLRGIEGATWARFDKFYDLPYFFRTWCIREVNVSKEVVAVLGLNQIHFNLVALAAQWIWNGYLDPDESVDAALLGQGAANAMVMRHRTLRDMTLHDLLRTTALFKCTDPRDKIYSTLDFAASRRDSWITPDYTKPIKDVFIEATREIMKEDDLKFLAYAFQHDSLYDDWPSWVPRWNLQSLLTIQPGLYNACGHYAPSRCEVFGNKLRLRGFKVDIVRSVRHISDAESMEDVEDRDPFLQAWATYTIGEKASKIYHTGEDLSSSFAQTLVTGRGFDDADFRAYSQWLLASNQEESSPSTSKEPPRPNSNHYRALFRRFASYQTFFESENEYIGLGSTVLQSKDQIWILLGSTIPMALRPEGAAYLVAGSCYVHGYMNGEAVRGLQSGVFIEEDVVLI
jgi:Heterokaryon incompatibility protein (HET)